MAVADVLIAPMNETKRCERCHEEKYLNFFRGRSATFIMPWCKECRSLDPVGAKRANDRLRQAQLDEQKLKEKNAKRAQRAREIRVEVEQARKKANVLALEALSSIDLSEFEGRERKEVGRELRRIKDVVKALR